jgi:hypothetical protein
MADVDKNEEDRLAPNVVQTWKDQAYQIVNEALLFFDCFIEDGSAPSAPKLTDSLAPLRKAIKIATYSIPRRPWLRRFRILTRLDCEASPNSWGSRRRR